MKGDRRHQTKHPWLAASDATVVLVCDEECPTLLVNCFAQRQLLVLRPHCTRTPPASVPVGTHHVLPSTSLRHRRAFRHDQVISG